MSMIVIVDSALDVHTRVVKAHLERRGVRVFVADPRELGTGAELSFWPATPERTVWRRRDATVARMAEAGAIWYRAKQEPQIPTDVDDPDERRFIRSEWNELVRGALTSLGVPIVNPLYAMNRASKPYQLATAHRLGLPVPDTVITNSAADVAQFVTRSGDVVHKTMKPLDNRLLATKQWDDGDERLLPELELVPTIFQGRVDGTRELRITVVGERLFAAEYSTRFVDGRLDQATSHVAHELPDSVARALLSLLDQLSLRFAAVDMRIDSRGEYQFLEANSAGQFLWIEIRTGMPISEAVADLLCDAARPPG
jgi:hypothetical protein